MKIFGLDIKFAGVENKDVKKPESADVYTQYVPLKAAIQRTNNDLGRYKTGVISAENVLNPQRYMLYQVYQGVELDAHLTACIEQRKNLLLSKRFKVVKPNGEEDEQKSKLLNKKWFYQFNNFALMSMYDGYSLIQFGDIVKDEFSTVELIPRQFVKPEFHIVTKTWTETSGLDYTEEPYKNWCVGVGEPKDLGLLLKAAPLVIWKKNALGAWAEYQNIFGVPARIGKTNLKDKQTFDNMVDMLANWGMSQYGVFGKDDAVELISGGSGDAFQVFDQMIERLNEEISKLILGQTSTISEKSFVGSAEVHERVLNNYEQKDKHFLESVHNYQLVPLMIYHGLLSEGDRIEMDDKETLTKVQQNDLMIQLINTGKYEISPEFIEEQTGIPVAIAEQEQEKREVEKIKNAIEDLYE